MLCDPDYLTEAEAQSKLRARVRVKQSGAGYTVGQTGLVHETGYDSEAEGCYVVVYWENDDPATQYNRRRYEDSSAIALPLASLRGARAEALREIGQPLL